jgi:Domain of unknown function (DUF5666)
MRSRSKILTALVVGCATMAVTAGGALADRGHGSKSGKATLKVEIRGSVTATTATSITISATPTPAAVVAPAPAAPAAAPVTVTCNVPAGTDLTAFPAGTRVKAKCKSDSTGLNLRKLRTTNKTTDKVEFELKGKVTAYTAAAGTAAGSVTVDAAVPGQTPLTCAVTDRTNVRHAPAVGDTAKVECKIKNGVLTAKKIKAKTQKAANPQGAQVETKGAIAAVSATSITVGPTTCTVADATLVASFKVGDFVELKCTGTPATLTRIHLED